MLEPAPTSTYLAHPLDWSWCGKRLLESNEVCGLDTETVGCDPSKDTAVGTARVVVFSVAIPDGKLHPRGYRLAEGFVLPPSALADPFIREWLESPTKKKVAHNGRYDRHSLANEDVEVLGLVDTLDIYRTIVPGRERYGLKSLVPDFLGCETFGDFKEIFSEPIITRRSKTLRYKVCTSHGRPDGGNWKRCEVCKDELVQMEETVVTETELKRRRTITMAEVCDVQVRSDVACGSRLVLDPGTHPLWPLLVNYAGFDAIAAAWLYQIRKDRLDGHRPAKVPTL